jgi:hypothetical protein
MPSQSAPLPGTEPRRDVRVTVELTGLGRAIAGREVEIALPQDSDYHQVVACLAERFPDLIGIVIAPDGRELLNANVISRNGDDLIMPDMLNGRPADGDYLTLLSIIVGG